MVSPDKLMSLFSEDVVEPIDALSRQGGLPTPALSMLSLPSLYSQMTSFSPSASSHSQLRPASLGPWLLLSSSLAPLSSSAVPSSSPVIPSSLSVLSLLLSALPLSAGGSVRTASSRKKHKSDHGDSDCPSKKSSHTSTTDQNLLALSSVQSTIGVIVDAIWHATNHTPETLIQEAIQIVKTEIKGLSKLNKALVGSLFRAHPNLVVSFKAYMARIHCDAFIHAKLTKFKKEEPDLLAAYKKMFACQEGGL